MSSLQTGQKEELSITEKVTSRKNKHTSGDTCKWRWEMKCCRYIGLVSSIKMFIQKGKDVNDDTTKAQICQVWNKHRHFSQSVRKWHILDFVKLEVLHQCICDSTAIALKTHRDWKLLMNSTVSSKLLRAYFSNMVCFPTFLQSLERCRSRFNEQCMPSVNIAFKSNWEIRSNTKSVRDHRNCTKMDHG